MQYAGSVLMLAKKRGQKYLMFTLPVRIRLLTSLSSIRKAMRHLNEAKLCSYGSRLCYIIGPYGSRFYKLQISANEFTLQVFSDGKGENMAKDAVLKTLSIMSYLSEECEPSIEVLYPYLIYVIAEAKLPTEVLQIQHVQSRASELILAQRINELRASERRARMECKAVQEGHHSQEAAAGISSRGRYFLRMLEDKWADLLAIGKREGDYHN